MKVLFLSQGQKIDDHPGWHDALERLTNEGFIDGFKNIPFFGYAQEKGWEGFYNEVIRSCKEESFDLVYFHHFHGGRSINVSPRECIEKILQLKQRPIVITSVGDLFSYNWMMPYYPDHFKEASKLADITFSTQIGRSAEKMMKWGAKNIVLSPLGICQKRFKAYERFHNGNYMFDIIFLGSKGNLLRVNPISKAWWTNIKRTKVVKQLHNSFLDRFGLFGYNWNFQYSQGPISFDAQQEIFQKGRFAIDAPALFCSDYYTSNRHLLQIASGVPTIMFEVPRIKNIYRENEHCYYISKNEDLVERINQLMKLDYDELIFKANMAAKYVFDKHTQYHRMKFKIDTAKRYKENDYILNVEFPFFLPEINLHEEMKYAIKTTNI